MMRSERRLAHSCMLLNEEKKMELACSWITSNDFKTESLDILNGGSEEYATRDYRLIFDLKLDTARQ
jgi:hypothetical protein